MSEVSDSGGLIVMIQDDKPTNMLLYSCDLGLTWRERVLLDDLFEVRNI